MGCGRGENLGHIVVLASHLALSNSIIECHKIHESQYSLPILKGEREHVPIINLALSALDR